MTEQKMKRCSKGDECVHPDGCWQPATSEYFRECKTCKDSFRGVCRVCESKYRRKYHKDNAERRNEYSKKWREENAEYLRNYKQQYHKDNAEKRREYMKQWHKNNVEHDRKYRHQYHENNRKKRNKYSRQWREENHTHVQEYRRQYHKDNAERRNEYSRRWHKTNPDYIRKWREKNSVRISNYRRKPKARKRARLSLQRYRARKRSLPDTLTQYDIDRMYKYFDHKCAVCGTPQDMFISLQLDHWIPVSSDNCPGTVVGNILPICGGSEFTSHIGCNQSKGGKDPEQWLIERFGKRKASSILVKIEAYFAWVKNEDDN